MLLEEGLDNVFARHQAARGRDARRRHSWGLEILCQEPAEFSPVLTAVVMPPGHDADHFRKIVLDNYNMSLGTGLSKVAGKVFRIGHLGECNALTLLGALTGVEMGLRSRAFRIAPAASTPRWSCWSSARAGQACRI